MKLFHNYTLNVINPICEIVDLEEEKTTSVNVVFSTSGKSPMIVKNGSEEFKFYSSLTVYTREDTLFILDSNISSDKITLVFSTHPVFYNFLFTSYSGISITCVFFAIDLLVTI